MSSPSDVDDPFPQTKTKAQMIRELSVELQTTDVGTIRDELERRGVEVQSSQIYQTLGLSSSRTRRDGLTDIRAIKMVAKDYGGLKGLKERLEGLKPILELAESLGGIETLSTMIDELSDM